MRSIQLFAVLFAGITLVNAQQPEYTNHAVPYLSQITFGPYTGYSDWGQSACGPTSMAMVLRYWFPGTNIDVPEIYHGATQANPYAGPLAGYYNIGYARTNIWKGTAADTGADRVPAEFRSYYPKKDGYSGIAYANAVAYLRHVWSVDAVLRENVNMADLITGVRRAPVIVNVDEGFGGHVVVVRGYEVDALRAQWFYVNDPYPPYAGTNSPENRKISYATMQAWFLLLNGRKNGRIITVQPSIAHPAGVRARTLVVDNGIDNDGDTGKLNANCTANNHCFQVTGLLDKNPAGSYIWQHRHENGIDHAYTLDSGRFAAWRPNITTPDFFDVIIRTRGMLGGSTSAYYELMDAANNRLGSVAIDQSTQDQEQAVSLGTFQLGPGSYVRVANIPAKTPIDLVMFQGNTVRVSSSVKVTGPASYFSIGMTLNGEFTVRNNSNDTVTLDQLVLGGRLDGKCPNNVCPDFGPPLTNITLQPWETKTYQGTYTLKATGNYAFFAAYQLGGIWNVNLLGDPGINTNTIVPVLAYCPVAATTTKIMAAAATATCIPPPTPLSVSCGASPNPITTGQSTTFSASVSGGVTPYSYNWSGATTGTGTSVTKTFSTTGTYTENLTVTDSSSPAQSQSTSCSVQVNASAPLTPSISNIGIFGSAIANNPFDIIVSATNIVVGQIQAWVFGTTSCQSGCRQPDTGITNVSSTSLTMHNVVLIAGDYSIKLRNTDTGVWSNASTTFTVMPAPTALTGSCTISPPTLTLGQGATVYVSASGGANPFHYYINSADMGSASSLFVIPPSAGTYTATFRVTDAGNPQQSVTGQCSAQVNPPPPLSASCAFNPNPITLGGNSTAYITGSGGTGGYTYSFNGGPYFSTNSQLFFPQDVGRTTTNVSVRDSSGATAGASCSLTTNGVAPSISSTAWDTQPLNRVNFSGTINGNAFTPTTAVWFCVTNTATCFQQPQAGVFVQNPLSIRVVNVNLTSGSWQVEVRTAYGSARSAAFTVQ